MAKTELRRTMWIAALAVLFFSFEDWLALDRIAPIALAVRVAWALGLVALSVPASRLDDRGREWLVAIAGAGSVGFYAALVVITGGPHRANGLWMGCIPLSVSLLSLGNRRATWLTCSAALATMPSVLLFEGSPWREGLAAVGEVAAACAVACYAVSYFARIREVERTEALRRLEVQEQLAQSERSRLQSEQLALIGRVATGMADELANPLSYATSNLEFLKHLQAQGQRLSPQDLERLVNETFQGLERVRELVADLWTFARAEEDLVEACSVDEVIDEALRIASFRLKRVGRIEKQIAPGIPTVRAHPRRLTHALVNLLVNTADALEEMGGRDSCVRVVVQPGASGQVEILVEEFRLSPAPALSPARKTSGEIALGLSREAVEGLGGELLASPKAEGGSRFTVRLPVGTPLPLAQA